MWQKRYPISSEDISRTRIIIGGCVLRIAVLADLHGNSTALSAVLSDLEELKPHRIVIAGDLVGYGPEPAEVIDIVQRIDAIVVKGNHDDAVVRKDYTWMNELAAFAAKWTASVLDEAYISYLSSLRFEIEFELHDKMLGVYHGSPKDPFEYVTDEERALALLERSTMDAIICGHTHIPMLVEHNGRIFLNPGGVGQPRDGVPEAAYALLDIPDLKVEFRRVPYDIRKVQEKMISAGLPRFLAARLSMGV